MDPQNPRDGYGYLDLLAAWKLFHTAYLDSASPPFTPFVLALATPQALQFEDRPSTNLFGVNLLRISDREKRKQSGTHEVLD